MIDDVLEFEVEIFLRQRLTTFTVKNLSQYLEKKGYLSIPDNFKLYVDAHPNVFKVSKNRYISRAGCFTGRYFAIKPTQYEIENGILIPGDRCMPFVDTEMLPDELTFFVNKVPVEKRVGEFPLAELLKHYNLYGEEYSAQYLAMDSCNADKNFAENDFLLPSIMKLTVLDMEKYYREWDFSYGDWIRLCVVDWNEGLLFMEPRCERKKNRFEETAAEQERITWNKTLETAIEKSLHLYGPRNSIEEQLAFVFFNNMLSLTGAECGSVEDFLNQSDKIGLTEYGVESRLWFLGEDVPAAGKWGVEPEAQPVTEGTLYDTFKLPIPEFMLEAYIRDSLYLKENDSAGILPRIIEDCGYLNKWQESLLLLRLHKQREQICKKYNWFADYEVGEVRHKALELYSRLLTLVCRLDRCPVPVQNMPQHELIVLSQLFGHTAKLISGLLFQRNITDKELDSSRLSVEGMEYSFEDIKPTLEAVMKRDF
ncbi:MAG: hypothetical protein K5930_08595 [Treponemataceae bacterium]|nr:hypothetical protein [Treponemataceae bacterium]